MKKIFLIFAFIVITSIEKIKKLRDDRVKVHDEGNHEKSDEILNKALEMIKS